MKISKFEVLLDYDAPCVLVIEDSEGGLGVALLVREDPFHYFGARVSRSELWLLLTDLVDLREVLTRSRETDRFTFTLTDGELVGLPLETRLGDVPESFLPTRGMRFSHIFVEKKLYARWKGRMSAPENSMVEQMRKSVAESHPREVATECGALTSPSDDLPLAA